MTSETTMQVGCAMFVGGFVCLFIVVCNEELLKIIPQGKKFNVIRNAVNTLNQFLEWAAKISGGAFALIFLCIAVIMLGGLANSFLNFLLG